MFASEKFCQKIEELTEKAEAVSQVEIVVVIAKRSNAYKDVDMRWALIFTFAVLAIMIYSPWKFNPSTMLLDLGLAAALGWYLSHKFPGFQRLLTSESRRRDETEQKSVQVFTEENVSATKDRTGVLIYFSLYERRAAIVTDLGVDAKIPKAEWNALSHKINSTKSLAKQEEALFGAMEALQEMLPQYIPAEEENPNEIPNAPRFRD